MRATKLTRQIFWGVCLFFAHFAVAEGAAQPAAKVGKDYSPEQLVEETTKNLLAAVKGGEEALKSNPDKYLSTIQAVLAPAINFKFIAKNVMGSHWKVATAEQRKRFIQAFTDNMVETLAKGMANYADFETSVLPLEKEPPVAGKVSVVQKITGPDGVNRVAYTLARKKGGKWQLINVVLDGVNLGKTFRSQFAQAVKDNKGNIDASINSWSAKT